MRVVYGAGPQNAAMAAWAAHRIPQMHGESFDERAKCIGVVDQAGSPLGVVVFTNWLPTYGSIEAHFASASRRWLTRNLINSILQYPFAQLDCRRVTAITPSRAASALRFLTKFGFAREGVVRQGFGDDDAIISGLLKDEWLNSRFSAPQERAVVETQGAHTP